MSLWRADCSPKVDQHEAETRKNTGPGLILSPGSTASTFKAPCTLRAQRDRYQSTFRRFARSMKRYGELPKANSRRFGNSVAASRKSTGRQSAAL